MAKFGKNSLQRLSELHQDLKVLLTTAIKFYDFSITCGYRNKKDQQTAYREKKSKLNWPNSKHNKMPAMAVDIVPFVAGSGLDYTDRERYLLFVGRLLGFADILFSSGKMIHHVRIGCDWNMNGTPKDDSFQDIGHLELI